MRTMIRFVTMCCLSVIFSIGFAPAWAADATVTNCTNFTGTGTISEAIGIVNTGAGGTITFNCSGTIIFTSQFTITTAVVINTNYNTVTFDGGNTTRFFTVAGGASLELDGFTLQNGRDVYDGSYDGGAAIINYGTLLVEKSIFIRNRTTSTGGAIRNPISTGTVTIINSRFSGNSAGTSGAVSNSGNMTISNSTFNNNRASIANGAIGNFGRLTIYDSTFTRNSAYFDSGAIYNEPTGRLNIISSIFQNNVAFNGSAIKNDGTASSQDSYYLNNTCTGNATIIDDGGNSADNALGCPGS